MTESPKDTLLLAGKTLSRVIQWASALAAGLAFLLIPVTVLRSRNAMPGFGQTNAGDVVQAAPIPVIAICATMALMFVALFLFFGKLHAIVVSAGKGDPFTPENAERLGAMAWLFLGVKIAGLIIRGLRAHAKDLVDGDPSGGDSFAFSLYDLDAVVIVIVLFILARIFRHGAVMREDLSRTV